MRPVRQMCTGDGAVITTTGAVTPPDKTLALLSPRENVGKGGAAAHGL